MYQNVVLCKMKNLGLQQTDLLFLILVFTSQYE